ncbi:MAG: TonB-dependent receptor plug domain-containing protein [Rhodospirillaceae bacterium]
MKLTHRKARLHASAATIALLAATSTGAPAYAQATAAANNQAAADIDEVVITGSRIVRDGYEAPTPVSVLGMEELNSMAVTNIADAVNRLPAFGAAVTNRNASTSVSSGTGGVNQLNLRGLGATRTLVLLDGKRMVGATLAGFDNNGSAVDINAFPNGLVSRVDVVTGGASAVYGSDALAGVVNFVLDKEFTGIKGSIDTGITTYGDNEQYKIDVSAGAPFAGGRGHFLVSGEHAYEHGIMNNPRPWADMSYTVMNNPNYNGSNGEPQILTATQTGLSNATRGGLIISCAGFAGNSCPLRGTQFIEGGTPAPFIFGPLISGSVMSGGDWRTSRIDTDPMLSIRLERESVFTRLSYDITDGITAFGEWSWSFAHASNLQSVPNFVLGGIPINADNPFIPASVRATMASFAITQFTMGSTNADMPNLQAINDRTVRRYVAGFEGAFDAGDTTWNWDASWTRSTSHQSVRAPGNRIPARYLRAIDSVRDANGRIVCRVNADTVATNDDPLCVPYNPMGINVNQDNPYIYGTGYMITVMAQEVYALNFSGEPFSTWAGPVSLALGGEHRRESVDGLASALDEVDGFFAGNFHASQGRFDVTEGYLETVVPLAKDEAWAQSFDVNAAVRFTDYSTSGFVTTWKLGATFSPVDDLTLRVTRSRDIRAPNLGDLFNKGRSGTGTVVDPRNNLSSFIVTAVRGNPGLSPEKADTTGLGVVFQPTFFSGFAASVDYYSINIKGAIAALSTQQYIDRCHNGQAPQLCSFISRDAAGNITFVAVQPANILSQKTRGMDIEASYALPLESLSEGFAGEISLRGLATKVFQMDTIDTVATTDGVGVQANGGAIGLGSALAAPEFRYIVSARYSNGPFAGTLTMRGFGSGVYHNSFIECRAQCPAATALNPTINNNYVPAIRYYDVGLNYKFMADAIEGYFVAENVLNTDPPFVAGDRGNGFYNGQGNSTFYDRLGRTFRLGARFRY